MEVCSSTEMGAPGAWTLSAKRLSASAPHDPGDPTERRHAEALLAAVLEESFTLDRARRDRVEHEVRRLHEQLLEHEPPSLTACRPRVVDFMLRWESEPTGSCVDAVHTRRVPDDGLRRDVSHRQRSGSRGSEASPELTAYSGPSRTRIPRTGASSASRKRAQKSVAPPALITATRMVFSPVVSVRRFDTPSSITV
jgi:hypothetical protein